MAARIIINISRVTLVNVNSFVSNEEQMYVFIMAAALMLENNFEIELSQPVHFNIYVKLTMVTSL